MQQTQWHCFFCYKTKDKTENKKRTILDWVIFKTFMWWLSSKVSSQIQRNLRDLKQQDYFMIEISYLQQPEKFVATEKQYDSNISHNPFVVILRYTPPEAELKHGTEFGLKPLSLLQLKCKTWSCRFYVIISCLLQEAATHSLLDLNSFKSFSCRI